MKYDIKGKFNCLDIFKEMGNLSHNVFFVTRVDMDDIIRGKK